MIVDLLDDMMLMIRLKWLDLDLAEVLPSVAADAEKQVPRGYIRNDYFIVTHCIIDYDII